MAKKISLANRKESRKKNAEENKGLKLKKNYINKIYFLIF